MESVTLTLSTEERNVLNQRASEIGLSPEELILRGLRRVLTPVKLSFQEAVDHTFEKNAELYRRLA